MSSSKHYLAVPYEEKDDAKRLGAKWDKEAGKWFIPDDFSGSRSVFGKWEPSATYSASNLKSAEAKGFFAPGQQVLLSKIKALEALTEEQGKKIFELTDDVLTHKSIICEMNHMLRDECVEDDSIHTRILGLGICFDCMRKVKVCTCGYLSPKSVEKYCRAPGPSIVSSVTSDDDDNEEEKEELLPSMSQRAPKKRARTSSSSDSDEDESDDQ